jgi:Phage protein D
MQHESLRIEIDEAEVEGLYDDLTSLEVELDDELANMFRLTLALSLRPDGSWPYLDDERFRVWKRVVVTAGLEDDPQRLITGFITHVRPDFGPGPGQCRLEIWGMDASVLMDREDKLRDWPGKKDSDIAAEIFDAYGLTPKVTDTEVVHEEEISTIIQRETDIQFLKRLALRNGYECFVDGDTGYFGPPQLDSASQPVLSVHFGEETNLNHFRLEVNALAPSNVTMFQVDRSNKEILDATAEVPQQKMLGAHGVEHFLEGEVVPGLVCISKTVTTGSAEMALLCQGLYNNGEWFVTGEGEVAANQYGNVLKPRRTVTVKGVAETYSGVYYVTHVTHMFSADGYIQDFRVKRNALMPTGSEQFSSGSTGLLESLI